MNEYIYMALSDLVFLYTVNDHEQLLTTVNDRDQPWMTSNNHERLWTTVNKRPFLKKLFAVVHGKKTPNQ